MKKKLNETVKVRMNESLSIYASICFSIHIHIWLKRKYLETTTKKPAKLDVKEKKGMENRFDLKEEKKLVWR